MQLRIDADGSGVFWINAHENFYFNATAALICKAMLDGKNDAECEKLLRKKFPGEANRAAADFKTFGPALRNLIEGKSRICDFCQSGSISSVTPFSIQPSAPYRMDIALTYACSNNCAHCYNQKGRKPGTLSLKDWEKVLEKVKAAGIPHVVFTGGEPTLVPELFDLIRHAEKLGLVSGLNTNGRRLKEPGFAQKLSDCGLDHIQITLESDDPSIHDRMVRSAGAWQETSAGIKEAVKIQNLHVMTNSTLLRDNASEAKVRSLIQFLSGLGLKTFALNALIYSGNGADVGTGLDESELPALIRAAQSEAAAQRMNFIWYTPTQYCRFDPQQYDLGIKSCTAARYSMCIEPDGAVLPCQSWYEQSVGNMLTNSWDQIWNHELCRSIRNLSFVPESCRGCDVLNLCKSGCPLASRYKPLTDFKPLLPESF